MLGIVASHGTHNVQSSLPLDSKISATGQNHNVFQGQTNQNSNPIISGKENNDHIFNHKDGGVMDVNYGSQLQQQQQQQNKQLKYCI
jgi:hypothetical protein